MSGLDGSPRIGRLAPLLVLGVFLGLAAGCLRPEPPLDTVRDLDLDRYLGEWRSLYEFPAWFQKGCSCTTARYSRAADGTVAVVNACLADGRNRTARAVATPLEPGDPSRLTVRFNFLAKGKYYILHVDPDYRHAVVGTPDREYLWVLSRDRSMSEETLAALREIARSRGFDVSRLRPVDQSCAP